MLFQKIGFNQSHAVLTKTTPTEILDEVLSKPLAGFRTKLTH